jgi:hypothetical protein
VVSGQWSVVSGQWSVVSGQWSVKVIAPRVRYLKTAEPFKNPGYDSPKWKNTRIC